MSRLVHKRKRSKKKSNKNDENTELKDKRCFFIANQVVFSQIVLLLLTGLITTILVYFGIGQPILQFWFIFLLIIPIAGIIIIYIKREVFYFNQNRLNIFFSLAIIWLSYTTYIGVFIDNFCGIGKTLFVGLFLCLYYIIGYIIAVAIRKRRFKYKKSSILKTFFISSLVLIAITLICGYIILDSSMKANNIKGIYRKDYGTFLKCISCAIGALIMVGGIGVFVSALLNYWMLQLLFENKSWNVETDSPNRLYLSCLSRTLIWMTLFWIALELFIPPVAGKKGGRGRIRSRGHSGGGNKKSNLTTAQRKKLVQEEWEKEKLV